MKVKEMAEKFSGIEIRSISAWNSAGNTPSKGFSFDNIADLVEAYGDENVWKMSFEWECGFTRLVVKMCGTSM